MAAMPCGVVWCSGTSLDYETGRPGFDSGSYPNKSEHAPNMRTLGKGTLHDFPHFTQIQWTKLKTHPICLYMDQIDIEMETCDEPRAPNNPSPFMSQGGDTKYGFAEKVVDGMSLTINSVTIRFISHAFHASFQVNNKHAFHASFQVNNKHAFHASFQLSRIRARSTTPQWKAADLRMTRIKDTERGMVLTFKEIDWQTLRIEADAVKTEKTNYVSTPVRLITNQSRIRIVIKKQLQVTCLSWVSCYGWVSVWVTCKSCRSTSSPTKKQLQDCSVVSSKLHLILDDLLWVLTDRNVDCSVVSSKLHLILDDLLWDLTDSCDLSLQFDCSVVSSKLHLILDDLLWVLTDSQLKAMASYMQSLSKIIRKSTEQNKRDASAQVRVSLLEKPRFQEFPVPHTPVKFAVSWSRPWISGLRVYGPGYFLTLPDSCSPCTCTEIYAPHTWRVLGSG
ncbi:UHRF1 binding protein 1 [Branchiostoma belcheri]|nr:UHRF1 binding protein 1 [Branchiostoma belcheri]